MAWGALLPWGIMIARYCRGVEGVAKGAWFKAHRAIQVSGLIVQALGLSFGYWYCQEHVEKPLTHPHAILGICVVALGIVPPVSALLRCAPPKEGETRTTRRSIF